MYTDTVVCVYRCVFGSEDFYFLQVQSLIRGIEKVQILEWGELHSVVFLPNSLQERATIVFLKILNVLLLCVCLFFLCR